VKPDLPLTKQRRWWWRWLRWLLILGVGAVLIMIAASYWAWRERVLVVNTLLERLGGEVRVQFTALEWENGVLHLKEVSATRVPTAQRLLTAEHIEWQPRVGQLRGNNLGTVKIAGAVLDLPLALFAGGGAKTSATVPWRVDSLELASTQVVLRDEKHEPVLRGTLEGSVRGGTTAGAFETASVVLSEVVYQEQPLLQSLRVEATRQGDKIEIQRASLSGGRMNLDWVQSLIPPLRGGAQIDWEGRGMAFSNAGLITGGRHELHLKDLRLQPMGGGGAAKAEALDLKLSQDAAGVWQVESGLLLGPVIDWSRGLEEALLPKGETGETASPAKWRARVIGLEVREGKVLLSKTERCPVAGEFDWNTKLAGLEISPDGVRSVLKQRLEIANLSLRWIGSDVSVMQRPFAVLKSAVVEVVPDNLRELSFVESLVLDEPQLELTPENGPWFDKTVVEPVKPLPTMPEPPFWQRLQFDTLTVKDARVDMAMMLAERVEATTRFEVVTEQAKQRLSIQEARVNIPKRANLPVLSLEKVVAVASLPEMWRTRRVESLEIAGGQVEVGDALMALFSGKAEIVEEKLDVAASRWTADQLDVKKLGVTLMSIAPGLPPVRFDVDFAAKNTPLDLEGLAENVEPQCIELTHLRIPSPYDPLRTVAEMDVIQVNYTLDGLLHRRIDSVQIISPLLYVGEDLFWYVEAYRKIMKGEAPLPDATFGPPAPAPPAAPGWHVDTLAVVDGRLLLAPKGVVLKGFGKPFPFSFTSKLESGQLQAVFDIPTDNYTLPELKLEFRGMKGQVRFNLPLKDRDNNLTETFTVEQLRWKQLHIEKAHLSVTYDAHGIYGSFGGAAYAGYVNGAFDIYMDDAYTWDGWVSGVDVNLEPVTTVLFPEYFLLAGVVDGKIIATGNKSELYQADAEFKNRSPGKFSIAALNDIIKTLPKSLTGTLTDQITRIGLETLRDFDYESVDSKARFYGREGRGHLRFTGPYGARNFDVNVYDHRWKKEPRQTTGSNDE